MQNGLSVENRGDLIIVTQPGTEFSATYYKPDDQPDLMLSAATVDPQADRAAIYEFRADAFGAALRKARELGWISMLRSIPRKSCASEERPTQKRAGAGVDCVGGGKLAPSMLFSRFSICRQRFQPRGLLA
jgi:hypothetical protein